MAPRSSQRKPRLTASASLSILGAKGISPSKTGPVRRCRVPTVKTGTEWLQSRTRSEFRLNRGQLEELADWAGEGLVWLDYVDLESEADELMEVATEELDGFSELIRELREKAGPLRGSSCLVVRPEGLRYRSHGLGSTAGIALGLLGAGTLLF